MELSCYISKRMPATIHVELLLAPLQITLNTRYGMRLAASEMSITSHTIKTFLLINQNFIDVLGTGDNMQ